MTTLPWTPTPRVTRWLMLGALLPFMAVVLARWTHPPSATDGDYARYLLHAKALAEGRAYNDIGYIYSEMNLVGPRLQPPGWPLVLAPMVAVFGTHWQVFRLLESLLVAAFGVITCWYFVRRGDTTTGIIAAAVVPLALETQYATSAAISDPLFCILVWSTLMLADADHPGDWRRGVALALMTVAALSVRVAGVALIPALLLFAILRRRDHGVKLVAPVVGLAAGAVVFAILAYDHIPFLGRTVRQLSSLSLSELAHTYRLALTVGALYPFGTNIADDVYHVLVAIPLVVGGVLFVRRQFKSVLACFVLAYSIVLLLAPVSEPRYAWPLIPLVMVFITQGLSWMGARFLPANLTPAIPRLILVMVAAVTIGAAVQLAGKPARRSLLGDPDTMALFDWVRVNSETAKMRVAFTNPHVLTLETDVPAMGIPAGDANGVIAELDRKGITHVVVPRLFYELRSERNLSAYVAERPSQFPEVFANATYDVRRFVARPEVASDSGSRLLVRPQ